MFSSKISSFCTELCTLKHVNCFFFNKYHYFHCMFRNLISSEREKVNSMFSGKSVLVKVSQNHRVVEVGRKPQRSCCPTPRAQAGPPRRSCPQSCPNNFRISPRMESPPAPWATCSSAQSPSRWKCVSSCSEGTSWVSVFALCLWSCTGHHWDKPGSVLFAPFFQVFIYNDKIPQEPSLLQA